MVSEDSSVSGSEPEETFPLSDEEEDNDEEDLQGQISEIPFEELQKARSDGRSAFVRRSQYQKRNDKSAIPKRANKNRPAEMSSKRPVSVFREVIQAPKTVPRDPRFETLCGKFEESKFKNSYKFLYDEELPAEKKRLQGLLQREKPGKSYDQIQKHINWIDTQLRAEELRRKREKKSAELNKKEKEAVKQGKKPFYMKNSSRRREEMVEKYKELKASGKLDTFLAKRRRKNAAKDHRYMPYRRPQSD